jgi:hypothetical protein
MGEVAHYAFLPLLHCSLCTVWQTESFEYLHDNFYNRRKLTILGYSGKLRVENGGLYAFSLILLCSLCSVCRNESFEYLHDRFCNTPKIGHLGVK